MKTSTGYENRSESRGPVLLCAAVFAIAAIASYVPGLLLFARAMQWPDLLMLVTNRDFANYWMAGRLVLSGDQQLLFSQSQYFALLQQQFGAGYPIHNWGYPPHFLFLVWPFGLLGYKPALLTFLATTMALYVFAVIEFRRVYAPRSSRAIVWLAVVAFSLLMLDAAQNGFLLAALLLLGFAWMNRYPMLAGLAFGVLTVKPQLGFLIPLLLLFDRNWKVLVWSSVFTVGLIGASVLLFGVSSWGSYLTETLAYQRSVMTTWSGIFLPMMPTVFGSIRTLGYAPGVAYLAQWPWTIGMTLLVIWLLWKETDPLRRIFVVTCGTFVISPYAFNYDMGALAVVAAALAGSQSFNRSGAVVIAIIAGLPAAVMNLGRSSLPVSPLLLAAGLFVIASALRGGAASDSLLPADKQQVLS